MNNTYSDLAKGTYELYKAFKEAGFGSDQALELTKSQFSFFIINAQLEAQRKAAGYKRGRVGYRN